LGEFENIERNEQEEMTNVRIGDENEDHTF
jgi:hypothetical protein